MTYSSWPVLPWETECPTCGAPARKPCRQECAKPFTGPTLITINTEDSE